MTTLNCYAASGLALQERLVAPKDSGLATRAGAFTAGTALTVATTFAAALETLVSAMATAATLPLRLITEAPYNATTTHMSDSAKVAYMAAGRTFGSEAASVALPTATTFKESTLILKEKAQASLQKAFAFAKEHKSAAAAALVTTAALGAYYFDLFSSAAILAPKANVTASAAKTFVNVTTRPFGANATTIAPIDNTAIYAVTGTVAAVALTSASIGFATGGPAGAALALFGGPAYVFLSMGLE